GLDENARIVRWLDGRYRGQTWETPSVPVPLGPLGAAEIGTIRHSFDATHQRLWGYSLPDYEVTAMMARVTVFADDEAGEGKVTPAATAGADGPGTTRAVVGGGGGGPPAPAPEAGFARG